MEHDQLPDPRELMELANDEPRRVNLKAYALIIQKLKDEKDFTFSGITKWLNENGVPCNQSAVYRCYAKSHGLTEDEVAEEEAKNEPEEDDEDRHAVRTPAPNH